MAPFLIAFLGSLAMLRYLAYEMGDDSLRFVGGIMLTVLISMRYFMRYSKRKNS